MVIKIIHLCFTEYEKKTHISNFSLKFDYNILKKGIFNLNIFKK